MRSLLVLLLTGGSGLAHAAETAISVTATTAGATIWIDGAETDLVAPARLTGLAPGEHVVEVRKACEADRRTVRLSAGQEIAVELAPIGIGGAITLRILPELATVNLDGVPIDLAQGTRRALSCGPHQVSVTAEGHRPAFSAIAVQPYDKLSWQVELAPLGQGRMQVDLDPDRASLWVDGQSMGMGDRLLEGVLVGPHALEARLEGYGTVGDTVVVEEGVLASARLVLPPGEARKSEHPKRGLGIGLLGGGVAAAGAAVGFWAAGLSDFYTYQAMADQVMAENGEAAEANAFYDEQVAPHKMPVYATAGAAALLGISGMVVVAAF